MFIYINYKQTRNNSNIKNLIRCTLREKVGSLMVAVNTIIHSFILETYIAPLQDTYYSEALPAQSRPKNKEHGLKGDVKFGRGGHQQGMQLNREIIPGRCAHHRKGPSLHNS